MWHGQRQTGLSQPSRGVSRKRREERNTAKCRTITIIMAFATISSLLIIAIRTAAFGASVTGICGVCKCGLIDGDAEHRDFVLSNKQRETQIILCQSRAKDPGGVLKVDL